ncbi:dihydrodipicolinate synthase family protein [Phytohabitans sp. ZYX-F-186]|uniref:Dihydrodipicolinate synthase family protein n=1 Tax=Phytohabitans maris TaxID=3071409 RepID=A0ABU0ZN67_9ACTN|nr:dihydrodipicolinate synthase family protein [Phytohabitans sp. ZYX-F-186]MDQ7908489.1 dihydrodipicolinate synthase family protein [Phytohabitans sp. ZYX-F-186]
MQPWHGVVVATATPFRPDLSLDLDRYAAHVAWLAGAGCHGVTPAGSLGEYQVLTDAERADLVRAAVEAAPPGCSVVPGVSAYGAVEARGWAEHAASAGAGALLLLPPNAYRAGPDEVVAHYAEVAKVGLPIVAYNNPYDTRVDLTPELLARIADEVPEVVAVKEFSGDVRRIYRLRELAPRLDVLAGADDVLLELLVGGAVGWIAGFPNALPEISVALYELGRAGRLDEALPLYQALHPIFRWDSRHTFIQAIKIAMDEVGRYGGPVRLPRLPLADADAAAVRADLATALAYPAPPVPAGA